MHDQCPIYYQTHTICCNYDGQKLPDTSHTFSTNNVWTEGGETYLVETTGMRQNGLIYKPRQLYQTVKFKSKETETFRPFETTTT